MIKKILVIILCFVFIFSFVGCTETDTSIYVNVESRNELSGTKIGTDAMINISKNLWYDSSTRIVYWWNGSLGFSRYDTTPTPYYAPNGFPYRYNPQTNTFEEINYLK